MWEWVLRSLQSSWDGGKKKTNNQYCPEMGETKNKKKQTNYNLKFQITDNNLTINMWK